ncbi:MAG TPA: SDR family NAD(P)-dependent oxidoreductase, partial [Pseudorhodoplanes sp.]|nr:SDR family NAD(P)-dependent oxidoreductase [Pseudorhodoplanes sp.]
MQDKVVVMSGATSGIGRVAAAKLAAMGARIVLIARDRTRGDDTLSELRAIAPGAGHAVHYADLSRLADIRRVGAEIAAAES